MGKKAKRLKKAAAQVPVRTSTPSGYVKTTKIFAYGTLMVHEIQHELWGESKQGKPGQLNNYEMRLWPNSAVFYIEKKPGEIVVGKVYELTDEQLKATDTYESEAYQRVRVETNSKTTEYVETYIKAK